MDRGTKIYAGVLLVIAVLLGFWTLYEDPKVKALNALLARDEPVQSYPFRFRVLYLEGNTAVMATPRSSAVPVVRVLGILEPSVAGRQETSPAFMAAQQRLAEIQTRARDRVVADPEISGVRWELDRDWLLQHGIQPD